MIIRTVQLYVHVIGFGSLYNDVIDSVEKGYSQRKDMIKEGNRGIRRQIISV
jgi:hypothetical protein